MCTVGAISKIFSVLVLIVLENSSLRVTFLHLAESFVRKPLRVDGLGLVNQLKSAM